GPYSGTQGKLGLGSMNTVGTSALGVSSALATSFLGYYVTNYLVVMEIQFNTSGTNDTITVYLNPVADAVSPGVPATYTYSSFDVGTITGIGLNVQGGAAITVDEIRVGSTYGSVVGSSAGATTPTTLALSVASGKVVSWAANNTDSYQPQSSTDGINWNNLGSVLVGSAVSSVFDPAPVAFYQVLDYTLGGVGNAILNGSFEIPDNSYGTGAQNWNNLGNGMDGNGNLIQSWATNQWGSVTPVDGTNLLYMEGLTANPGVAGFNVLVTSDSFPIPAGGVNYPVSFSAANPLNTAANPQYEIGYFDSSGNNLGYSGWITMGGIGGSAWHTITNNFLAPTNTAYMTVGFLLACGAVSGADSVLLIDNVKVGYELPGPTNVLTATVQSGAVFTATVQTNGVTVTSAGGSVAFQTNSVAQSTGIVGSGIANSAPAIVPASYTITAIYSGDATFIGSTNTLVVGGNFGSGEGTVSLTGGNSTVVMSGIAGDQYSLERATNVTFTAGISNFPASMAPTGGNVTNVDNFSDLGGVVPPQAFYRLQYIP
ncbi:MAG: hypothetical protein ACREE6_02745, partial [Limisphaerales bacterium]